MDYRASGLGLVAGLVAGLTITACGDDSDDGSGGSSSGGEGQGAAGGTSTGGSSTGGSSTGGSSTGGSSTGGSSTGGSSTGGGGGGQLGCVEDPSVCTASEMCCAGVPYPPEGICDDMCELDSDRNIKHDVRSVDRDAVLERLAALPIAEWRYDRSPEFVHMGPMAQDFHAAFGLGESAQHIAAVDEGGVTMAAIQALYHRVEALRLENEARARENEALREAVSTLRARGGCRE